MLMQGHVQGPSSNKYTQENSVF